MTTQSQIENSSDFFPERIGTRADLSQLLTQRWSPRAFSQRSIEPWKILRLFEAARWSPSSANEQPWRFIVATKDDTRAYDALYGSLAEANQRWAQRAPVLALAVAHSTYSRNQRPNNHAWYDLGQSVANLTVEATNLGLGVHQMGGFDEEKARERLSIPRGFEPVVVFAIGYTDRPDTLPEDLRQREEAHRSRQPLESLMFTAEWGKPSHHIDSAPAMDDPLPSSK